MSEPVVPREEARAVLETRRELGRGYDDELVERFAERIEQRLEHQRSPARTNEQNTAITIVSILAAIPLIAIAGGTAGTGGVALVCLALVAINYFARR